MKKGLLCLLVVLVCLVWGASFAWADCMDTTIYCHKDAGAGARVGTFNAGNCWNWLAFSCIPCDANPAANAMKCNADYPECQGNCGACVAYGDLGNIAYCYDKNGTCRGACGM
jgi:hypothetical protein